VAPVPVVPVVLVVEVPVVVPEVVPVDDDEVVVEPMQKAVGLMPAWGQWVLLAVESPWRATPTW